ncbi:MAG: hypothetical protein ACQES9_10140 [Myxococcota bacterium]
MKKLFYLSLLIAVFGCTGKKLETEDAKKNNSEKPELPPSSSSRKVIKEKDQLTVFLVSNLVKNKPRSINNQSQYCILDKTEMTSIRYTKRTGTLYKGFEYRLGKINVIGIKDKNPKKLLKAKTVIAKGKFVKDLTGKIDKVGKCKVSDFPMYQMRADWGSPECGTTPGITTFKKLKSLSYFKIYDLKKIDFIKISKTQKVIEVEITNNLPVDLPQLQFKVHYEIGPGKPQPHYEKYKLPPVEKGESIKKQFPLYPERKGSVTKKKKYYRLDSCLIKKKIKTDKTIVILDLNLSVPDSK